MTDVDSSVVSDDDPQPRPPNPEDYSGCCDSGCSPCVFDLYWDAVTRYEIEIAAWRERHGFPPAE